MPQDQPQQPPPQKPGWLESRPSSLTEVEWKDQVLEMRAWSKRVWKQSGGQRDVYPYRDCPEEPRS